MPTPTNTRGTPVTRIYQQITQAIYGQKHEVIEGVEVDFRHPKFDSENWETPRGFMKIRDLGEYGPRLSFPWSLRSEADFNQSELAQPEDNSHEGGQEQDIILESGDRLFIRNIETTPTDDPLLRGCNPDRCNVYVNIQRAKGGVTEVQRPIVMKACNELWERDFVGNYYSSINMRVRKYFNLSYSNNIESVPDDGSFAYRALRKLIVISRMRSEIEVDVDGKKATLVNSTVPDKEYHDNSSIWFTINDAVALGYYWAKSEDERNFLVESAKRITEKQAAAGRKSGRSRCAMRENKLTITKTIADKFRAQRKTPPTQEELIDHVDNSDRWKACREELGLPRIPKPARSGIEDMISTLFGSQSQGAPKSGQ
jgi:hypothetical protein